jgi:phage terminase large subunit-like protein
MRAGPKGTIDVPRLDLSGYPRRRSGLRERFIADHLITPRGHGAGEPLALRPFQREIIRGAFAPGIRTALVSIPRANGKTMLTAALALAELFVGGPSAEVLVVASDQRQANIALRYARRMVELTPALAQRVQVYADRL